MWITGNDAVNRYDGSRVKIFNLNRYFSNCSNLQQGYGFAEDSNTDIYVGSVRGLYIYHRAQDKFTLQKIYNDANPTAMPIGYQDGKIWCYNKQYELASFDVKTKKIEHFGKLPLPPMKSIHVYDLPGNVFYFRYPFIAQNKIWVTSNNDLLCYDINTKQISYPLKNRISPFRAIYCSCYDSFSQTIYLGANNTIIKYDIKNDAIKEVVISKIENDDTNFIGALVANKDKVVIKLKSNLYVMDTDLNSINSLNNSNIYPKKSYCYGFDKNDRLWLCDDGVGQTIVDFKPPLLPKITKENILLKKESLAGIGFFAEFPNGDVLVLEKIIHLKNNSLQYFDDKKIIKNNQYVASHATDGNRKGIWEFFSYLNNKSTYIYFINEQKQTKIIASINKSENTGYIQDIEVLDNHSLLCSFQNGLYWFFPETKTLKKIPNQSQVNCFKINKLSNNRLAISYLNNDMWLASVSAYNNLKFIKPILPKKQSFYMQEDIAKKCYWVGTNNGVYMLDKNFNEINKFDANDGMAGTYIYGLLLDNENNVWCSHQHGLSSINSKTHQIINYTKEDGIQDWDYNNRAFYKTTDGTLFFGGVNGYNYFKPPVFPKKLYKPEVYIDEILINSGLYQSKNWVNTISTLNLKSDQNNLSFYAVVKDLENSEQNILYRLNNGKWNTIKSPNYINFSSLASSNYKLELATYDKFSNKILIQKTISIHIKNPFYRTTWFWSLITFIISTLIYIYFNNRKLEKQKNQFEQQLALEQQRNKITADLHDDIGSTLSSLQLNSAVANQFMKKLNLTKVEELLNKIENQSKDLADKIGDIIWSMKPKNEEFMTISSRIKNFGNDILGATTIYYTIDINPKIDTLITDITTRKNIIMIAKESLNNVVKYSKANSVKLRLSIKKEHIVLTVMDDGIGFDPNTIKGNGITNMRKRAQEINGTLTITSNNIDGTVLQLKIPCP